MRHYQIAAIASLLCFPASAESNMAIAQSIAKGCKMIEDNALNSETAKDSDAVRQFWMCGGAIEATTQLMLVHHEICPPHDHGTRQQEAKIVNDYMSRHTEEMDEGFAFVIFRAFQDKWHCPKKTGVN